MSGVTRSEQYLNRLGAKTFLSLWSFPNLYRDQGKKQSHGQGKELCDLLVIFGNDVLIFSDKFIAFPDTGSLVLDWSRWFSGAIDKSAKQIWGAERWIKKFPERVFVDRKCTKPIPISFPKENDIRIHRIVVAHGVSERCKKEFRGGSGSLIIIPNLVGDEHVKGRDGKNFPFTVGNLNPEKGFVHILDDTSLDILMLTLDTISDFVDYLIRKEKFFLSGNLISASGEEELLAYYLGALNENAQHDFVLPGDIQGLILTEGLWQEYSKSTKRKQQVEHNSISYWWDGLIERLNEHIIDGTQYWPEMDDIKHQEEMMRRLAREPRWIRRYLATQFLELKAKTPITHVAARVLRHILDLKRFFLFFLLPLEKNEDRDKYRKDRLNRIEEYFIAIKSKFPSAEELICIATETGFSKTFSYDTLLFEYTNWTEEDQHRADKIRSELGLLEDVTEKSVSISEYPEPEEVHPGVEITRLMVENYGDIPCPCGSGKSFSECHGISETQIF